MKTILGFLLVVMRLAASAQVGMQPGGGGGGLPAACTSPGGGVDISCTNAIAAGSLLSGAPSAGAKAALPAGAHGFSCDESSTQGVPAAGVDYIRCDSSTHKMLASFNGSSELPFTLSASTLVAFWKVAEGTGSTSADSSTSANNLTLTGTSWVSQAGLANGGLSFAGTIGSHADPANFTNINFNYNQPFSVSMWFVLNNVQGTGIDNPRIISRLVAGAGGGGYDIGFNYNAATFCNGWCFSWELVNTVGTNELDVTSTTPITEGVLHNIVATYSGSATAGGVVIYLDGTVIPTTTVTSSLSTTATNSQIPRIGTRINGSGCTSCYFQGILGPLGVWNRVLASGEVATIQGNPYAIIN